MLFKVASYRVPASSRDAFVGAVAPFIAATKREPGVKGFRGGFDLDEPEMFTLTGIYQDEGSFQDHVTAPHFQDAMNAVSQMVNGGGGVQFMDAGSMSFTEGEANAKSDVQGHF